MMHHRLYEELRRVAQERRTTSYGIIAQLAGIDRDNPHFAALVGKVLDEINRAEHAGGRPLLSAVVISQDQNRPGSGFFHCARELGLYRGGDEDGFWLGELQRVYDHWSRRN